MIIEFDNLLLAEYLSLVLDLDNAQFVVFDVVQQPGFGLIFAWGKRHHPTARTQRPVWKNCVFTLLEPLKSN